MKREMVCISCPLGCALQVSRDGDQGEIEVQGNRCDRGVVYAREEILAPRRRVTATVALSTHSPARLPVATSEALDRELIPGLLSELYGLVVDPPVRRGEKVLNDFGGSGVDVVATRSVDVVSNK